MSMNYSFKLQLTLKKVLCSKFFDVQLLATKDPIGPKAFGPIGSLLAAGHTLNPLNIDKYQHYIPPIR